MGQTLVIHPGALGDVLLAIPALRALKHAHRDDDLVLAAQAPIGDLLHRLGVVDTSLRFDVLGLDTLFADEPALEPPPALARAARVICWFGSKDPSFASRLRAVASGAIVAPPTSTESAVWEHLLATIGRDPGDESEPVAVPPRIADEGRDALARAGWDGQTPIVMVHPGAGGVAKRWSPEGFGTALAALHARSRLTVIVHEGPADREPVGRLCAQMGEGALRLDNPSLPVLAGALVHVAVYLGNDSGISHLAAAVGAPSIVLFTREALPWRPWPSGVDVLTVSTSSVRREDLTAVVDALERRLA